MRACSWPDRGRSALGAVIRSHEDGNQKAIRTFPDLPGGSAAMRGLALRSVQVS